MRGSVMKQFLLFSGSDDGNREGVNAFVQEFDSVAEAILFLVDNPFARSWWHLLDTQTGEVTERRHLRVTNGAVGVRRSDWAIGTQTKKPTVSVSSPEAVALAGLEAELRDVVQ